MSTENVRSCTTDTYLDTDCNRVMSLFLYVVEGKRLIEMDVKLLKSP